MKKKVLLISSRPAEHSAGLAVDLIKAIRSLGYDVDFLSLKDIVPHTLGVFVWFKYRPHRYIERCGNIVTCPDENRPFLSNRALVHAIKGSYDYVVTSFWQDMLNSSSIEALFERLHCPVINIPVDFFPYSGGCFYPGECRNYEHECIDCPVFAGTSREGRAHENYIRKKRVYSSIPCAFIANSYTRQFIIKTGIVPENRLFVKSFCLDESVFRPLDIRECRKSFGVPEGKDFVIFARYAQPGTNDGIRKGIPHLHAAMSHFLKGMSEEEKSRVSLLFAGVSPEEYHDEFGVDALCVGFLNQKRLIDAYNAASVFVSTSIDDAGPSMVNQSMACGTPVLAFEIGTALDVLEDGVSGYMAPMCDDEALAKGLSEILSMSAARYGELRRTTRQKAMDMNSISACAKCLKTVFDSFDSESKK